MTKTLHIDGDNGLWIPPEMREFDRQVVFRTPRGTIQHFNGNDPLDAYYGMINESAFGSADSFIDARNPELCPDKVSIKREGEEAKVYEVSL